jgi:hypothetical protein
MKRTGFLITGLSLALLVVVNGGLFFTGVGCSSTPATAPTTITIPAPTATPFCSSPTNHGTTTDGSSDGQIGTPSLSGNPVTLVSGTTAISISFRTGIAATTQPQGRFAIYADNGANQPGNLVVKSAPTALAANTWNTIPLPPTYLPAGTYWIISLFPGTNSVMFNISGGNYIYNNYPWSEMPLVYPLGGAGTGAALISSNMGTCP